MSQFVQSTQKRLSEFNKIRGKMVLSCKFWDLVVITAVDVTQKEAYEMQIKNKLDNGELPLVTYIVVADPCGSKIGNGGSNLLVINELYKLFKDDLWIKKVLVIHAGGFSQRIPTASVLGKAFVSFPVGDPIYQAIEVKLATYMDIPSKIQGGGMFVCCPDTIELYNDDNIEWTFPNQGFTGLAHPSPLSIAVDHGVYVLSEENANGLVVPCRQFLHKPAVKVMESKNCVFFNDQCNLEQAFTDSAFFISPDAMQILKNFYDDYSPLHCEIDAYGDFLQAVGTNSTSGYIYNTKNVCSETSSLIEIREKLFIAINSLPLYAVVLGRSNHIESKFVNSAFYHIGTTREYLYHFTADKSLMECLEFDVLSHSAGLPYKMNSNMECNQEKNNVKTPYCLVSILGANCSIGKNSIMEYCSLHSNVNIGDNCILSNCEFPDNCIIPSNVLLHTIFVTIENGSQKVGYTTIVFHIDDNMKKSFPVELSIKNLKYFNAPFGQHYGESSLPQTQNASLWNAKLFPISGCITAAMNKAFKALHAINFGNKLDSLYGEDILYSMEDILKMKNIQQMISYRENLREKIYAIRTHKN